MRNCPRLLGVLPNHLHSLKKLVISRCSQLVVSLSDLPMLCELKIEECAELVLGDIADFVSMKKVSLSNVSKITTTPTERLQVSTGNSLEYCKIFSCKGLSYSLLKELGLLGYCGSLRNLEILDCPQLVLSDSEPEEVEEEQLQVGNIESLKIENHGLDVRCLSIRKHFLAFVTEMRIEKCPNIVSFAKHNIPTFLKSLVIGDCKNLRSLVDEEGEDMMSMSKKGCRLEHLKISKCPCLISLSLPVGLGDLVIRYCTNLKCLSSSGKLPIGLKHLTLFDCPELEFIAQCVEENTCLESIDINQCSIKSLPEGLDKLNHLQKIMIGECQNLVSLTGFVPTSNLTELVIYNCGNLRALPNYMHKLTSLEKLEVQNNSGDAISISIPEEGLCTSLTSLEISVPRNYKSLGLHRLSSLKRLYVTGAESPNMESFPPEEIGMMLPPSLTSLSIQNFKNLKCLSSRGFQNVTFLHELWIGICPKLTSLPEKHMLLSLSQLYIFSCPLLKQECEMDKGKEWSKIAHIPRVVFHGSWLIV